MQPGRGGQLEAPSLRAGAFPLGPDVSNVLQAEAGGSIARHLHLHLLRVGAAPPLGSDVSDVLQGEAGGSIALLLHLHRGGGGGLLQRRARILSLWGLGVRGSSEGRPVLVFPSLLVPRASL